MNKVIEKLTKDVVFWDNEGSGRIAQIPRDDYDQALAILGSEPEQPPDSELAKRLRAGIRLRDNRDKCGDPVEVIIDIKLINEACTRLDRSKASRKKLLTACEEYSKGVMLLRESDSEIMLGAALQLKKADDLGIAALAKAKEGGE